MKLQYKFNTEKNDSQSKFENISYVICSTPRSGSTLLSKGLASTLVLGLPHEYFNVDHKRDYQKRWGFLDIATYISFLKKYRVSKNGVFGFKIHYNQYEELFSNDNLSNYFDDLKYIRIIRKNKILQGISLEKASQTNFWSSEFKEYSKLKPKFNYRSIKRNISIINRQELCWSNYFDKYGIKPHTVYYEELESNYEETIDEIIKYLGIDDKFFTKPKMTIQKQRNFNSIKWKIYFKILNFLRL